MMNDEWLKWTRDNLARGCDPDEIRGILIDNNFSELDIAYAMEQGISPQKKKEIERELQQRRKLQGRNPAVNYKNMANPALVKVADGKAIIPVETKKAQIYKIPNFLSSQECDDLMALMDTSLRPSTITTGEDKTGFRTSSTCDLTPELGERVTSLDDKISNCLGLSLSWSEQNQGQKYLVGQEFKAHTDYFEPNTPEFEKFGREMGQRTWTFMIYLNDTPDGGATYFPNLDLTFLPEKGTALTWNNLTPKGLVNPNTLHHGMPVHVGEKWIITKWFRDKGAGSPYL